MDNHYSYKTPYPNSKENNHNCCSLIIYIGLFIRQTVTTDKVEDITAKIHFNIFNLDFLL
jgi:hypothetical protein